MSRTPENRFCRSRRASPCPPLGVRVRVARCRLEAVRVHGDVPLAGGARAHAAKREIGRREIGRKTKRTKRGAGLRAERASVPRVFFFAPRHHPPRRRFGPVQGHGPERAAHVAEQRRDVHGLRKCAVVSGRRRRGAAAMMTTKRRRRRQNSTPRLRRLDFRNESTFFIFCRERRRRRRRRRTRARLY